MRLAPRAALAAVLASALVLPMTPLPAYAADPSDSSYLVTFAAGTAAADQVAAVAAAGATDVDAIPQLHLHSVRVPDDGSAAVLEALRADSRVARVEADRVRAAEAAPDDPSYADQWALPKIGWDTARDSVTPAGSAVVAVLDTGVDASHDDLAGKLVAGTSVLDSSDGTSDANGHGTAMAGIVAAGVDNGTGTAGVGYAGVKVMPVTVLGADGTGQDSDIISGVVHAADHGADVILMAFSNPGYSSALQTAVDYAWSKGAVLVAAAGNDSSSTATFPAGDRGVVGVSNTTRDDSLSPSSNTGDSVFLGAPGTGIATSDAGGGVRSISGTSASAAIVAGSAALLAANDAGASNGVIVGRLARTADAAGTAAQTGNGRVNLDRALADTSTEPVKPAGAAPVASGGPYVGPYVVAANENGEAWANKVPGSWTGTLNGNNSSYNEGDSIPFRFTSTGEAAQSSRTVTLKLDVASGARHFADAFTSYNRTTGTAANPCAGCPAATAPIPADSEMPAASQPGGVFTIYNATITNVGAYSWAGGVRQIQLTYTVSGTRGQTKDVTIAVGAHLARQNEWGTGNGAAGYPGGSGKAYASFGTTKDVFASVNPGAAVSAGVTISGTVYNDADGDGGLDAGETGLAAVPVSATGPITDTAVTSSTGGYTFSDIDPGTYSLDYTVPAGFSNTGTKPLTGVAVAAGGSESNKNFFAEQHNKSISGTVYNDANSNGSLDAGEQGIAGVTVSRSGASSGTATTNANGAYSFTGLAAGTYTVDYTVPTGYVNSGTKPSAPFTLTAGAPVTVNFFAKVAAGSISGTVFNDVNGNGLADVSDAGIGGVVVTRSGSTATATTDADGTYTFSNVSPGTYTLSYTTPTGYANTTNGAVSATVTTGAPANGKNFFARRTTSTAVALATGTTPSTYGDTVTFRATVTSAAGNPSGIGSVTFNDGTTTLCSAVALVGNTATCMTSSLAAGDHSITAEYSDTAVAPGYSGSTSSVLAHTVAKKTLTVTADANPATADVDHFSKVYGAANPTFAVRYAGFQGSDSASSLSGTLTFTTSATAASAVGPYAVTPSGLTSDNYTINFVAGTLDVTKKVLTVTADADAATGTIDHFTKVYGSANPAFTVRYDGFAGTDGPTSLGGTLGFTTDATATSPVGPYSVTPNGLTSSNYTISYVAGTLDVTKKALTIDADDKSTTYGTAPVFTVTATGLANGESLAAATSGTLSFTPAADPNKPAGGPYTITPSGLTASNYTITFTTGSWTVGKKALTVTADNQDAQYSDPSPVLTARVSGFVNGEGLSDLGGALSVTTVRTVNSAVGGYDITPSGLTSSNYAISFVTGTFTVLHENAVLEYTGDTLVSTGSTTTSSTKSVVLSASVTESPDGNLGSMLTGQKVRFDLYTGTSTTPKAWCTGTVGAVTAAGSGVATCSLTLGAENYSITMTLLDNSYYEAPREPGSVTVVLGGTGFTTGGGWLREPTLDTRSNFGFTVKYLKNANIQGNSLYIYRRTVAANTIANPAAPGAFIPAGTYNWIVKSNAMTGLTQECTTTLPKICTARFTGKSTITAENRTTGVRYSLGGNNSFQVDVTDKGEPGASSSTTPDTYALRVWDSTGTYYQIGTATAQLPINGGNIQIRP